MANHATMLPLDPGVIKNIKNFGEISSIFEKLSIDEKYEKLGGKNGFLGAPLSPEQPGFNGGKFREYTGGIIYWHPSIGAFEVHGDILSKYKQINADKSPIGYPKTDVIDIGWIPGGLNLSAFENGYIIWKLDMAGDPDDPNFIKAFVVHGEILSEWGNLNDLAGPISYPTSDEIEIGDGIGTIQYFNTGVIYFTSQTGAHAVYGDFLQKYHSLGAHNGFMGYPKDTQGKLSEGVGIYQNFTGGTLFWSPSTGIHEVHGKIRDEYASMGWESSSLGYPTYDQYQIPGTVIQRNIFENGSLDYNPEDDSVTLRGTFSQFMVIDWCYDCSLGCGDDNIVGQIYFNPIIANTGTTEITGPGLLQMSVRVNSYLIQYPNYQIPTNFKLKIGASIPLRHSNWVSYKSDQYYRDIYFILTLQGEQESNKFQTGGGGLDGTMIGAWITCHSNRKCIPFNE